MPGSRKRAPSTPKKTPKRPRTAKKQGKQRQLPGGALEMSFQLEGRFFVSRGYMILCFDHLHHQMLFKQKLHHTKCTLLQMLHLLLQGALLAPQGIMVSRRIHL